ncbi:putative transposon protein [Symbiodinium microadriaticum]|uniref:Putative transposon protein n=1 Tax=Symbiodinium microadriaticum TaxID=2951 RepID=A0A1Q9CG28_SYMMI|nr:putative transposon protein [Symbiodinium microadriaticum]
MMNGVLPQREGASREEPPRVELREAAPTGEGHDRNLGEAERTVAMEYSFQSSEGQPVVRWVAFPADENVLGISNPASTASAEALRLGQHQMEAPLLYARQRPPSSTSSEEVQAEVQRQLRNFVEKHDGEARRLREEVERLQVIGLQRVVTVYHKVIGLQRVVTAYHKVIGLQRVVTAYHEEIGLQRVTVYHEEIGLQRVIAYHEEIGLQRVIAYHEEIGLQRVIAYHEEIGLQRVVMGYYKTMATAEAVRTSTKPQSTSTFRRVIACMMIVSAMLKQKNSPVVHLRQRITTPSTMELLGVIATGMRQLQEAQLRQLERKPDAPEVVKPGISSLPALSAPGQDTSPVDIQDWLEEVGSVMTDLSDSSWEWWLQTKEVAEAHYRKWVKSTPMEKISLSVPKTSALEQGRYGRVNARAAGMILASLPQEVKSEMITKKVTGSTPSLIFKLLTAYRPGGEKEKTLLLQQLTAPDSAANAEEAVQGLRRWGRWHARAKDLTVTVPDPVLMIKGLAAIVATVLSRHQDVWLRTSMVRQKLQLDSNPTEEATLDYHKHLQAEMELLSTATNATRGGPRIKSAAATTDSTTATTPSSASTPAAKPKAQPTKERPCKWFAKTDGGCRRGVDCQYAHDWGATQKAGRCLVCSSTAHMKKDCPVKEKGSSSKLQKPRPRQENATSTTSTSSPAARALGTASEAAGSATSSPQPAGEPSPSTSPTTSRPRVPPEEERPDDLKHVLADASKMLKTMMATNASASTTASTAPPTYESLQKQLDELKLKSLKVTSEDPTRAEMNAITAVPSYLVFLGQLDQMDLKAVKVDEPQVEQGQGTLLDSGSTHVLRPARNEDEKRESRSVYVTLAGDEQRLLSQAPSGSIIIEATNDDAVQSIIPFGKVIEVLGCTLKWTRGGFYLHHPKHGRIKTRVKSGCPEITDAGQAAAIIAELEMKKVSQPKEKTQELQNQLCAIRMMEQKKVDWRIILSKYAEQGDAAEGLQAIYLSPAFQGVANHVRVSMAPSLDTSPKAGWEYLKLLPLPRRVRKRLFKSNNWVLNMFAGEDKSNDAVQGDMYKALLWGAMNAKVRAVIAAPPTGGLWPREEFVKPELHEARRNKDVEMLAKTLFLYLVSYAAAKGGEPSFACGAPVSAGGFWDLDMIKGFQQVVSDIGVTKCEFEQGALGHPASAPMRFLHNIGLNYLEGERDLREPHLRPEADPQYPSRRWCPGLRRAIYDGLRSRGVGDGADVSERERVIEMKKLTKEQGWRLHVLRDHVPFRRDCEQCVMMLGTGRPHRRVKQKSSYVLSVDVGGPLRAVSKDAHGSGYKYFLAASYTKPKFEDQDMPPDPAPEDLAAYDYDFKNLDPEPPSLDAVDLPGGGVFESLEEAELLGQEDQYSPSEEDLELALRKVGDTKGLWDDDDFAAIEQEKEAQEDQDERGNHEIPVDFLYYFKPLKGESGKHVLKAIQEIVLQLRMENLPVVRIHADRAHEMRSEALRQWTLDNNILLTRTEGQAPQSNGTAERAVRFLKGRARSLLRSADLGVQHWATAMATAAHTQREERLRPEFPHIPAAYGAKVAIKKKYYGQGGKLDLLPRWVKGIYMGPVWDVNQGSAILEEETNRFTVSTHLRPNLVDPGTIGQEPEMVVEPPPRRRLRGKTMVDEDGIKAKMLEAKTAKERRAALQKEVVKLLDHDGAVSGVKRPQLLAQGEPQPQEGYTTFGAFQHGGVLGITNATKENPELTRKIAQLVSLVFPEEVFTSVTVVRNARMPVHKDSYNDRNTYNLVIPLNVTSDAGVWQVLRPGDPFQGSYMPMEVKGKEVPGQFQALKNEVKIRPDRLHCAVQPSEGPRLLLAAYTVGGWKKLKAEQVERLTELGLQVPDREDEEYLIKRAAVQEHQEASHSQWMVQEDELVYNLGQRDSLVEIDDDVARCAKAAAENLYTYNIEELLEGLSDELRVVHTVHPKEVDQHLSNWIDALKAEMKVLQDIGAIKRLTGSEAREFLARPGVQVVPGKAVYMVKPPSKEGAKYRRKARIVGCGNFQPRDDQEDNYSGGAAAEAVRLGVTQAARRRWAICTGDVVSAFLRAPVPDGTLLALRPPAVLVRAGLAEPSEVWSVHMALYCFRTSPRWWGNHRNSTMKGATTSSGLIFEQGTADPEVWRVKDTSGQVVGLIIVYVDDFFITGPRPVCEEVFSWLSSTWETTPCAYASSSSSVRFLGMEIREDVNEAGESEGYTLDQEGYLEEVLRHHGVKKEEKSLLPATKEWMCLSPETYPPGYTNEELKLAQSLTGELAWLGQRCRPDLAYVVSIMSSLTTKDPAWVALIGRKTLAYLNYTRGWKLRFRRARGQSWPPTPIAPMLRTVTEAMEEQ